MILLTNDDGAHSPGLLALRDTLAEKYEVCVIAPERERTCIGHAITLHKPLRIRELDSGLFTTNGSPADCVYLGTQVILDKKPDLIVSGINSGPNMGRDVNYSGTVAAAKEGAFLGISSLAVSVCARQDFLFHEAALVVQDMINILSDNKTEGDVFLNINIPNIPRQKMAGFMVTRLGKRIYNGKVLERVDPRGGKYYWIGGTAEDYEHIPGTDFFAVDRGYVSVTPLGLDMTDLHSIKKYKSYFRRGL